MTDFYFDRMVKARVINGTVRLDLAAIDELDNETKKISIKQPKTVILPIDGFMQAMEVLEGVKAKIVETVEGSKKQRIAENSEAK